MMEREYGDLEVIDGGSDQGGTMGDLKAALTKQVGPLQVWHWIVVIVGGLLLAWYIRSRSRGVEAEDTTVTDYSGAATSASLSPEPTIVVQPTDPAQTEYYESILGLLEQIGQQGIAVVPPEEGWPITTPVPINVDVGGEMLGGIGTSLAGIAGNEAAQTRLARIAQLQAQITALRAQIAGLREQKARATTRAQRQELTARIKGKVAQVKRLQGQIRAIRQSGTGSAGGGADTGGASNVPLPF